MVFGLQRVMGGFGGDKLKVHTAILWHEKRLIIVDGSYIPDAVVTRFVVLMRGIVANYQRQLRGLQLMKWL